MPKDIQLARYVVVYLVVLVLLSFCRHSLTSVPILCNQSYSW
jgi:hypothetical protein